MRKKGLVIAGLCLLICLTGCQGTKVTAADKYWKAARKMDSLETYVKENKEELDMEALKAEAESGESTLGQQFKAIALMSALEYQLNSDNKEEMFLVDYPVSGPYVDTYLAKVNTEGEAFWSSLEDAFYPYDYFMPVLAAAQNLNGETLVNLISGIPDESKYGDKLAEAIGKWVKKNPVKLADIGDDLMGMGYFDEWKLQDFKFTYFYDSNNSNLIETDTVNDGLAYVDYLGNSLLPTLEEKYGGEEIRKESELTGNSFYSTNLSVIVDEELKLEAPEENGLPETIEIQGKKVVAFYQNPLWSEFENSPAPLRIMGDFMLNLPQEERPGTLEAADYYLVLTPDYEYGSNYQFLSGKEMKIREVYSSTSVDLYEAATGRFLRHLGNVMEMPSRSIVTNADEDRGEYPELVSADTLYFIYQNVNEPESYITLTDNTVGLEGDLEQGQPIVIGNWEITCNSSQVVKEFQKGSYLYSGENGFQLVRGNFTITNRGNQKNTFMPTMLSGTRDVRKDTFVQVTDASHETYYDTVYFINLSGSLNGASLEPGETREGELVFQVPEDVVQAGEPLFITVFAGYQEAFYPVG